MEGTYSLNVLKAVQYSVISGDVYGPGKADIEDAEECVPTEDGSLFG
jgi:hypothetical protein